MIKSTKTVTYHKNTKESQDNFKNESPSPDSKLFDCLTYN